MFKPSFVIGPKDNPYLLRWYLIPRNRWLNIYLHHILRSDDDRALHDHPWPSLSLMLWGTLGEYFVDGYYRYFHIGQFVYRRAEFAHRLVVPVGKSAWTLFMTGPRCREWGFLCPKGWRHWKEYSAESAGNNVIGKGCDDA